MNPDSALIVVGLLVALACLVALAVTGRYHA